MSRADMKAAFDTLWRALGDAGVSNAATLTVTPDLITVTPTPDAAADDGWDLLGTLSAFFTYGPTLADAGRIAFGQVDGVPVLVCAHHYVVSQAAPADAHVLVLKVPGARRPVVVDATGGRP